MNIFPIDETFKIFHLETQNDWEEFFNIYKSNWDNVLPLENIFNLVKNKARTALEEKNYVDIDYRNEYSNFYSKSFKKYEQFSTRLHFFEEKINPAHPIDIKELNGFGYLGYLILRPTIIGTVGRTAICSPFKAIEDDCSICNTKFYSHIAGHELSVNASPFIQQDSMVITCAQASIWMATRYNSTHKGIFLSMPIVLPHDITENACKYIPYLGRPLPSTGLTVIQMINSLINMEYFPVVYLKDHSNHDSWNPIDIIFRYISSKIPVIVTVPGHAFTVFGYMLGDHPYGTVCDKNIVSQSCWISSLIIHDDQVGPYRLMPVNDRAKIELFNSPKKEFLSPSPWCYETSQDIDGIIVPLPEKIYLLSQHLNHIIKGILEEVIEIGPEIFELANAGNEHLQNFIECLKVPSKHDPITYGGFIISSFRFQEYLKDKYLDQKISQEVSEYYQKMRLPYYIWVIEISTSSEISTSKEKRQIYGEIILDSTANRYGPTFLSIHLPGILIVRDPHSENIQTIIISKDNLYLTYPNTLF